MICICFWTWGTRSRGWSVRSWLWGIRSTLLSLISISRYLFYLLVKILNNLFLLIKCVLNLCCCILSLLNKILETRWIWFSTLLILTSILLFSIHLILIRRLAIFVKWNLKYLILFSPELQKKSNIWILWISKIKWRFFIRLT